MANLRNSKAYGVDETTVEMWCGQESENSEALLLGFLHLVEMLECTDAKLYNSLDNFFKKGEVPRVSDVKIKLEKFNSLLHKIGK